MNFISLINIITRNVITVDKDALLLRLEIDGRTQEIRLKPYYADILYALFSKHPIALGYGEIMALLKRHNLVISDFTRMHRKISEIRTFLINFHPSLNDLVYNTRGIGYGLPLRLKNLHQEVLHTAIKFKNAEITKNIAIIKELIVDAIQLTSENKAIKHAQGYVINRDPVREILIEKIAVFNECEHIILEKIRVHEADFTGLRAQYLFSKLRTYIGLARISEYPISETQWVDWFEQEVWLLFEDLQKLLKVAESL
jgi:hypothetical protein